MKYVFIINPNSGGRKSRETLSRYRAEIEKFFSGNITDEFIICVTEYSGHALEIAAGEIEKAKPGEKLRFYALGGDGTLLEIARACVGKNEAAVGAFPLGSGNDYVRQFGKKDAFLSVSAQLRGHAVKVDAIRTLEGDALNICSMGLDARVAYNMSKFKNIPGVSGSLAYDLALVKCLFGRLGDKLRIKVRAPDGEKNFSGRYIFALGASGQYYGGGYRGAPEAVINDGLLDVVLIKTPPLYKIPFMIGAYKRGEYMKNERFRKYLTFLRGTEMEIDSESTVIANRDGECGPLKSDKYQVLPSAVNFILPEGVEYPSFIYTKRLYLRPWMLTDLEDFYEFVSDEKVMPAAGSLVIKTREEALKDLRGRMENALAYAIVLRENNKVIGAINYQKDVHRPNSVRSRSIGYELNSEYWGHGYMPEALDAMVKNAFENTDTEVLSIGYMNGNERSRRVIEKCGFKFEGIVRKCFRSADGKLQDDHSYSMTSEDYFERKAGENVQL